MGTHDVERPEKVIFNYETGHLPPPFSHQYSIELDLKKDDPDVVIDLKYTDREDLSEDEILEEGYSLNDDFSWKGTLPGIWKKAVLEKINQSNFIKNTQPSAGHIPFLVVSLLHANRKIEKLIPAEEKTWEPFLQEIIQAAFEKAGKERPLQIRFVATARGQTTSKELMLSFADRNLQITHQDGDGEPVKSSLSWQSGQKSMNTYTSSIMPMAKEPAVYFPSDGHFIDVGDGFWYDLDQHVESPTNRKDLVAELIEILNSY